MRRGSYAAMALACVALVLPAGARPTYGPRPLALKPAAGARVAAARMQKRWLFVWQDLTKPSEVDKLIARFPAARAAGYNGIVCSFDVAPAKAPELRAAARQFGLAIIVTVMGGAHDHNYVEGVLAKDALFMAHGGTATFTPDNPTTLVNGDFEQAVGSQFTGWAWQDDVGVTTFADHTVVHGGKTSLRMENIGQNANGLCRIVQPINLQPHRQYHIWFWIKTENLQPGIPEVKVLTDTPQGCVSWQTFHTDPTQDWKRYDLVFNSLDESKARIYLGLWGGKAGKIWWDDVHVEEIGLVNVLRRPGCPVTVRSENGVTYQEGRDYQPISDPQLNPWRAWHGAQPAIRLTPNSAIREGERLRVSYYHPLIIYEDRVTFCLSEPKVFADWRADVKRADELLHPAGFLMEHDELRCVNQCALCRSKNMTVGELLAWNVHKAAAIIRDLRPDASIWVWSDMFDPMHNAQDHYFAVNGTLAGSWKGLDKDVGIVNWDGGLAGKNCKFFADLGLKQILAGYYDGDASGAAIRQWIQNTKGVVGIEGAMYTTWQSDYTAMGSWAKAAWGGGSSGGARSGAALMARPAPPDANRKPSRGPAAPGGTELRAARQAGLRQHSDRDRVCVFGGLLRVRGKGGQRTAIPGR